jgi:endo-1,4-beta-xylanase
MHRKQVCQIKRRFMPKCSRRVWRSPPAWGMSDKYSWVPGFYKGFGSALLFDENYQPKPAYFAVEHVLKSTQ